MKTKVKLIASISSVAVVAGIASAVLFVPHTVTVSEYMDGSLKDYKAQTYTVKTSLFDSMKNPIVVKSRNIPHAEFTGITTDGALVKDGNLGKVYKDETVSVDYKPVLYTASFKEDGKETYTVQFKYGENPAVPKSAFLTSKHPYENFKQWTKVETKKPTVAETGSEDLSVSYNATYEGKTYKVAYDLDGGSAQNPGTYQYGKGIASFANASKDGYTFDGWFLDAGKTKAVTSFDKNVHGDQKLYAKFHENPKPVVEQSYSQSYSGSYGGGSSSYSAPASSGYSAPAAAPAAPAPAASGFPYIGNAGAIRIGGYTAALQSGGGQGTIDAANTALFEPGCFSIKPGDNSDGVYRDIIYDHAYQGTKNAVLSGAALQWRKANGQVVTLHLIKSVAVGKNWWASDGTNYNYICNMPGCLTVATCYGSGNLLGFYG